MECFCCMDEDAKVVCWNQKFYNLVNNLTILKPTWKTNILGTRNFWIDLNRSRKCIDKEDPKYEVRSLAQLELILFSYIWFIFM